VNDSLYRFLAEHCAAEHPQRYLEIGTRDGGSLEVVLQNSPSLVHVVCSDTWGGDWGGTARGSHDHIERLLQLHLYTGSVRFLDGDSRQTIPTLREEFDLVLVDGDHSEEGGAADLENVWPLVAPNGCLAFHDITHPKHLYLQRVFGGFVSRHASEIQASRKIMEPYGVGVVWKNPD
jgi:predicted O-methyltransferase YrrM